MLSFRELASPDLSPTFRGCAFPLPPSTRSPTVDGAPHPLQAPRMGICICRNRAPRYDDPLKGMSGPSDVTRGHVRALGRRSVGFLVTKPLDAWMEEIGRVSGGGAHLYAAIAVQLIPLEFYRLMAISYVSIFSQRIFDLGQNEKNKNVRTPCFSSNSPEINF